MCFTNGEIPQHEKPGIGRILPVSPFPFCVRNNMASNIKFLRDRVEVLQDLSLRGKDLGKVGIRGK